LVVIDDGSRDNTYQILCQLSKDRPLLCPLTKKNNGHGPTVLYGYRYSREQGADYIFQTDSDGQTDAKEFDSFWKDRKKYDAVIGNRVLRGYGKDRKFVEDIVCLLLRIIFGVKVPDANTPFRLMNTSIVAKYIDKLSSSFEIPNIMFITYFVYHKEKVKFSEITFSQRRSEANSINIKRIIKVEWRSVGEFMKLKKRLMFDP